MLVTLLVDVENRLVLVDVPGEDEGNVVLLHHLEEGSGYLVVLSLLPSQYQLTNLVISFQSLSSKAV